MANTDHSGYHETITRYFLTVLAGHADAGNDFDDVLADPASSHEAALHHWRRDTLFSVEARRAWVPPDLVPIAV